MTERQANIFGFILDYARNNQQMPTLREIGRHFGITSNNAVHKHLAALELLGMVEVIPAQPRGIRICGYEWRLVRTLKPDSP
jgi:repressor LexA